MPVTIDQTILYCLTSLLILVLPGAGWMTWRRSGRGLLADLADAVGLSIAFTAILALIGFRLDLTFTRPILTALYAAFSLPLLIRLGGLLLRRHSLAWDWAGFFSGLLGLLGLIGVAIWRLYQARSLALPAWVDSVHHTLVVQVILENGGVPATLEPYLPVEFSYHYGFHILAALFASITGAEPTTALLWFGQILNAAIGLSVYRLGMELWDDKRRASLAGLLVSFAFQMPAYYLTWGRYTLITGLVLLPLAMAALLRLARQRQGAEGWIKAVLLTTGVALSHYTALLLLGFFTVILAALALLKTRPLTEEEPRPGRTRGFVQPGSAAAAGVLLAVPWLLRVWRQLNAQAEVYLVSPLTGGVSGYWNYILYLLGPPHSFAWLAVGAAGMVWGIAREKNRVLALWGLLLTLLTLPWGVRLGPFRPDHMAIVLFLPGALLAADFVFNLLGQAVRIPPIWLRRTVQVIILLAVLAGLVWGAVQTRNVINSSTIIAVQADVEALDWVRLNTPPDARFIINTTPWMGSTYRGTDGGYWLLPLTGRQTILPPVMYTYGAAEYVSQIEDWARRTSQLTTCGADFSNVVAEFGATYLYVREGKGSLTPEALTHCSQVINVYRRDGVFIYEIVQ